MYAYAWLPLHAFVESKTIKVFMFVAALMNIK